VVGVWLLGVLLYVMWPSDPPAPLATKPVVKKPPIGDKPPEVATRPTEATPKANQVDPTPVANVVTPDVGSDAAVGAVDPGPGDDDPTAEPDAGVEPSVLTEENNRVLDDFRIGEYRRKVVDGQSIESMLERMRGDLKTNEEKRDYFQGKFDKVSDGCSRANTKIKLIDCDDKVRKLHVDFYKVGD
jgi:hypothetical protein